MAYSSALTIYSSAQPGSISPSTFRNGGQGMAVPGYAMVRQERDFQFSNNRNNIRFTDVAALIDPTTVLFESLTDPTGTRVVEQNFQFDLVSTQKLLEKYIDKNIGVVQSRGTSTETFNGVLTSTNGGLVLKNPDGSVRIVNQYTNVNLPSLPGGLISKPTLVWDVAAQKTGNHKTRVSYQTGGMSWWSDYNLSYSEGADANSCNLDVGAWVTIINQSGAGYQDTRLKLVAGDVQRAQTRGNVAAAPMAMRKEAVLADSVGFEEKTLFEYHLYTLGFPTTLPDNSTKQLELFPTARGVPCEKALVYQGQAGMGYYGGLMTDRAFSVESNKKVDVYLSFKNSKDNHMGMPLPAGKIRVSKLDSADKTLEFIGEDVIDHTPKEETVRIRMGSAFDVVGDRTQKDFRIDINGHWMEEDIEVKVRNQKNEAVNVQVRENLYRWTNWQISKNNQSYNKTDSRSIVFPIRIAKGAEAVVKYTARYTW
ncbi:MAG: hypothetical protein WCD07_05130 [Burkholderiales bacterium]